MRVSRFHRSRREFLIGCGQAAAVALSPREANTQSVGPEFHVHPNYRERTSLASLEQKKSASFDNFPLEKEHDQIAAMLAAWSADLRESRERLRSVSSVLAPGFRGWPLHAASTKTLRHNSWLKVCELTFDPEPLLPGAAFLDAFEGYLSDFSQLLIAELQVIGIDTKAQDHLMTSVRYELVGTGQNFYREQRIGHWQLDWKKNDSGKYALTEWQQTGETRARSQSRVYSDLTVSAFGKNSCYAAQFAHGVDYWRTVLDGASGIDIYGHNGISVGDTNGDGRDDVYVCQPAGLPNRLFRNRGDGTFEDVTDKAGVGILENTACALFADFANHGHQDLLVVRANGPLLFLNDGKGQFRLKPDAFRFSAEPQGTFTGAAAADYDRDGMLDVYFCLYVYYQGADQYKYPTPYHDANNGPPNILMHNNGDGTFEDFTSRSGLNQNNTRYSFCCGWTDIDNDGWPDLYVVNDFGRKNLYRNNGDGTFTDIAAQAGVEDMGAGMSICSFDYDNDSRQDLYVANMWSAAGERITAENEFRKNSASTRAQFQKHAMGNTLLRNEEDRSFNDRTSAAKTGLGRWSWSSDAWDFDHDGFLDLYITNGMISGPSREDLNSFFWRQVAGNSPDEAKASRSYEQGWNAINELIRSDYTWSGFERNVFFANDREGTFSDVSAAVGLDFPEDSRAFVLADFDGDGRLEILLKNRNGPQLRLLKNQIRDLPPSVSFRLKAAKGNRDAIGAFVTIETSAGKQTRMLQAGSGFLSQHTKEIFFGLGKTTGTIRATIRWPSGFVQSLETLPADHRIEVEEGSAFRAQPFSSFVETSGEQHEQIAEALPDAAETWLLLPLSAPDFSLRDQRGTQRTLSSLRGNRVLLHLSTTESSHCRKILAELDQRNGRWSSQGCHLLVLDFNPSEPRGPLPLSIPVLSVSDDTAAVYNILYRALFDRHRDLTLPTSLLLNENAEIVKIYQGLLDVDHVERDFHSIPRSRTERLARGLPFGVNASTFEPGRNHLSLGSAFFQHGYFEQAQPWFELALRDDPSSAEAHYGLGSVQLKQNKTEAANASFERALQWNASYSNTKPDAWNNLGLIAIRDGRTDQAIECFQKSLQLDPDHVVSLQNLGNAYRQEKRWDEARHTLEQALTLAPDEPEVSYSLAMVFAQIDQPDRAYKLLQRALDLRPAYPEAMNNLGVLYLRTQRRDQAVAEFEACIRSSPAFDQPYLNLARVYLIEGDRERARAALLDLLKQHPDHVAAQRALQEIR